MDNNTEQLLQVYYAQAKADLVICRTAELRADNPDAEWDALTVVAIEDVYKRFPQIPASKPSDAEPSVMEQALREQIVDTLYRCAQTNAISYYRRVYEPWADEVMKLILQLPASEPSDAERLAELKAEIMLNGWGWYTDCAFELGFRKWHYFTTIRNRFHGDGDTELAALESALTVVRTAQKKSK